MTADIAKLLVAQSTDDKKTPNEMEAILAASANKTMPSAYDQQIADLEALNEADGSDEEMAEDDSDAEEMKRIVAETKVYDNSDLEDEVMEFLKKEDKSVLLVSGYSGSGKSTLAKRIRLRLWKQHQEELKQRAIVAANEDAEAGTPAPKQPLIVPVWVHLPTLAVPLSDLMHESLAKQHGFGEAQLREFESKVHAGDYKLVIVMDGVDELKKEFAKNNLYDRNDLELWREEKTETESWPKVLYFCRAEMLQPDSYPGYEKHFAPSADSGRLSDPEVAKTYFDELVSTSPICNPVSMLT